MFSFNGIVWKATTLVHKSNVDSLLMYYTFTRNLIVPMTF